MPSELEWVESRCVEATAASGGVPDWKLQRGVRSCGVPACLHRRHVRRGEGREAVPEGPKDWEGMKWLEVEE